MRYPEADMTELVKAMNDVKRNHRNGEIRYKAFVALSVCENPEWYARLMENFSGNSDAFFVAAKVMNDQLLTQAYHPPAATERHRERTDRLPRSSSTHTRSPEPFGSRIFFQPQRTQRRTIKESLPSSATFEDRIL